MATKAELREQTENEIKPDQDWCCSITNPLGDWMYDYSCDETVVFKAGSKSEAHRKANEIAKKKGKILEKVFLPNNDMKRRIAEMDEPRQRLFGKKRK